MSKLKEKVRDFPQSVGVYLFKDSRQKIVYIGKAKNLKKRVASYFKQKADSKTRALTRASSELDFILTRNEYEALILENSLIKEHSPRYNINLKDGKSYPMIRLTADRFPRLFRTRVIVKDGSRYFGPFTSAKQLDAYLDLVNKLFPLRRCRGPLKKRRQPCLYYHIKRCAAPCAGLISEDEYRVRIGQIESLLAGKTRQLIHDLTDKMRQLAAGMEFEKAASLRDLVQSVKKVAMNQEVVDKEEATGDYLACCFENHYYVFTVLQIRSGRLVDRHLFRSRSFSDPDEAWAVFLTQFYSQDRSLPAKIFLPAGVKIDLFRQYLTTERQSKAEILFPRKGRHLKILNMALENSRQDLAEQQQARGSQAVLSELRQDLNLKNAPRHIEGFDIAHLAGKNPVASAVVFIGGRPHKKSYRRFRLKTLDGAIDDFEALREAAARRYARLLNEEKPLPDLVLIDGGRGQVNAARGILDTLGLTDIPVIGLAKQNEEIYLVERRLPLKLPETSASLKLLQAVRDEAHRFATSLSKRLRKQSLALDSLEAAPGIGPARSKKLLTTYGSLQAIIDASASQVAEAAGLSPEQAQVAQLLLHEQRLKE